MGDKRILPTYVGWIHDYGEPYRKYIVLPTYVGLIPLQFVKSRFYAEYSLRM